MPVGVRNVCSWVKTRSERHRVEAKQMTQAVYFLPSQRAARNRGQSASTGRLSGFFAVSSLASTLGPAERPERSHDAHTRTNSSGRIAVRSGLIPTMFITRVRLWGVRSAPFRSRHWATASLESGSHPSASSAWLNGCSTVSRRTRVACGF